MNEIKDGIEQLKKEGNELAKEAKQRVVGYIVAAFGLVTGLAWNEAIRALLEQLFPLDKNTLVAKFGYAILVTLVLVIVTVYLVRLFSDKEQST